MCTKTKTSYGCGHSYKDKTPCGESPCEGVDKYAFLKEGDCHACRSGGEAVTRGRDGQGRHAREIQRSSEGHSSSSGTKQRPDKLDITGGRGPWGPVTRSEKAWDSPTRRMADRAWLNEHEDRISDLREKFERVSLSSARSSREQSPRLYYEQSLNPLDNEPAVESPRSPITRQAKLLPYEIQIAEDDSDHRSRRYRRRQRSHDSDDSMPYYLESPVLKHSRRRTKTVAPLSEYNYQVSYDEGKRRRRCGTKTEPETYAHTVVYNSSVSGSPYAGGYLLDPYEIIQPQRINFVYPHSYRVR